MSLDGISNNYKFTKQDSRQTNLSSGDEELSIFENTGVNNEKSDIISPKSSDLDKENDVSDTKTQTLSSEADLTQVLTNYLDNLVLQYEEQFSAVKENNGVIAKGWDWFKNITGIGAGSDKVKEQIDDLKKQIEELKKDSSKLNEVYKSVTGNELNDEELNNIISGKVDLSNSEIVESVSKYTQGQKQCTNVISGIASGLTVVGLIAAGIVAAPFTGGLSLVGSLAAIGTLTLAGTAAYMIPQALDGLTEKDGYSFEEGMEDVTKGAINSAFTAVGMGAGKAVGNVLGKTAGAALGKTAGKTIAGLAASETTSVIIGDGIGIGNYLTEAALNDKVDFSWSDLGKTAATSTTSSLVAGGVAYGLSSTLRPLLTSGTTAQSQIIGRLASAGITGSSAATAASAAGGVLTIC